MAKKVLDISFRATDEGVIAMMKAQGASADQLARKLKEVHKAQSGGESGEGGVHGTLESLKKGLGKRSSLGELTELAVGAGAVAGLGLVADRLSEAAKEAKELKDQFDSGEVSAGAMVEKIAGGIPVFGSFFAAGRQIKGFLASFDGLANSAFGKITGLADLNYAEKINKEEAVRKELLDINAGALERQLKLTKDIGDALRQDNARIRTAGADPGSYEGAQLGQHIARDDRLKKIEDDRQAALDANKKDYAAGLAVAAKVHGPEKDQALLENNKRDKRQIEQINKDFAEKRQGELAASGNEENAIRFQHQQDALKQTTQYYTDINKMSEDTHLDYLRMLHKGLDAEFEEIQRSGEDKKQEIKKQLEEQLKAAPPEQRAGLISAANKASGAVDSATAAKQQQAAYSALYDGEAKVLQARADAGDKVAESELKSLQASRDQTAEADKLHAILASQTASVTEREEAERQLKGLQEAQAGAIENRLKDQQSALLQQQATYGDTAKDRLDAEKKLQAIKLEDELKQREADTASILNDPAATAAQKQAAINNLKAFTASSGREYDKAINGNTPDIKRTADLQEQGLLIHGDAAAAKSEKTEQIAKNTAEGNKITQSLSDKMQTFLDKYLPANPPTLNVRLGVFD